ncbi:hypothetical protein WN51_04743 [Melipona quadrifasciata]|uniref:Uncharacterized protein n=1 Tax=Melipona quadrifasciata TaxID=166423 RepID=A0A0M8ZSN8_9HYME|nr:hypothetical protein WN51_04743 [Melipona quadrifasciata]
MICYEKKLKPRLKIKAKRNFLTKKLKLLGVGQEVAFSLCANETQTFQKQN